MSGNYASDIGYIQELLGPLHGSQIGEVEVALGEDRDGVIALAERIARESGKVSCPPAVFSSGVRKKQHTMGRRKVSDEQGTGHQRHLVPAAEAFRRLYDAKIAELQRYGMPERERIPIAMDYACGEVHRCHIQPMPPGGVVKLEDDLYRAIGFDRVTGLRFTPEGETHA